LKKVIDASVDGAKIIDVCILGDKTIEESVKTVYVKGKLSKGIGFPTSVAVNNVICHFSPLPSDDEANETLKTGDLVKIQLGTQIDGYAAIVAHSFVIGATKEAPATGRQADVIQAAQLAMDAAIRLIKPGNKNMEVTKAVDKIAASFQTKPVEGMLSHNQEKNVMDGKKQVIINPTENQFQNFEKLEFSEGEVWGVDIFISSGEGKPRQMSSRTTIYKKTDTRYDLKLKASRAVISEISNKFGPFPFPLRELENERKARMGIVECAKHKLLIPYDVMYEKQGEFVAQFFSTILLTKNGTLQLTKPPHSPDVVKSDKKLDDEEIVKLLASPLKPNKKKNKKKKNSDVPEAADDKEEPEE